MRVTFRRDSLRQRKRSGFVSFPTVELLESRTLLSSNPPTTLWFEGEDTSLISSENFNQHGWYSASGLNLSLLSDQDGDSATLPWLTHFREGSTEHEPRSVSYEIDVPYTAQYQFWVRLNSFDASYRYRINGSEWQTIDVEFGTNQINLVRSGIDVRFIEWVSVATVDLQAGMNSVEIEILSNQLGDSAWRIHGAIDAFVFTNESWIPVGNQPYDPDPSPPKPTDWFTFRAGPDSFSSESIIDLSSYREDVAGSHGALQRVGDEFQFQDGTPVKFWGVNARMPESQAEMVQQAKFFAKYGINLVRMHPIEGVLGNPIIDPTKLDAFDQWFAALRDEGIYVTWSVIYNHRVTSSEVPPELFAELPGTEEFKETYGLATFVDEYQVSQWRYFQQLLDHVNPYTGLPYKDDPALAMIESRNEDSIFFHNPLSNDFIHESNHEGKPAHFERLQSLWETWVGEQYSTDDDLAAAWGAGLRPGDSVVNPVDMKMYAAWEMRSNGPAGAPAEAARMGDFIRFLAEMQRNDYREWEERIRGTGFQGLTVSTAWMAGQPAGEAANLWTDDALDVIDRHSYAGGGAGGENIALGRVENESHLSRPLQMVPEVGLYQVEDKPFMVSEWASRAPNEWKAEISPIMAFYGLGLQGWDASLHFTADSTSSFQNGWPRLSSYATETPHYMGQFPALVFAIENGHIEEGEIVAGRRISFDDATSGVGSLNKQPGGIETPTELMAVGRVTAKVGDGLGDPIEEDVSSYWDETNQRITSNTGQLVWDYGNEFIEIRSEKTQGIVGFAGSHTIDLPGVVVETTTDFVSLLFTPLDNLPLTESENILITAIARDRQSGAVYSDDGDRLLERGTDPLLLEPVIAGIDFKGDLNIDAVDVVDPFGVPTGQTVELNGDQFQIDGRYETYYYRVQRSPTLLTNGVSTEIQSDTWTTVTLDRQFESMVVIATPRVVAGMPPLVPRIRNADGNSFELMVQRSDGISDPVTGITVDYLVAEEGVYTSEVDGITMEAVKFTSTLTDRKGSWVGESRTYQQAYNQPVVLGQVMSVNDGSPSVFWARGSTASDAPDASTLYVGKHVGEDSQRTRNDEMIGYIVIEEGVWSVGDHQLVAGVGSDSVWGVGDSPGYSYDVTGMSNPTTAVLSMAGIDGNDGGWPVLFGTDPVQSNQLFLAIDEDQFKDDERRHTSEQVAYVVLEGPDAPPPPRLLTNGVSTEISTDTWTTVTLDRQFESMVVIATPRVVAGMPPLVPRIRNADGNSFELMVQRSDGISDPVTGITVDYLVAEEGVYTSEVDGITMEAVKFTSTLTDRKGSWVGESRTYQQAYNQPVVLGQVMSVNDGSPSVFWARGSTASDAPDASTLYVGKHVGEDSQRTRNDEMIGYIVIEEGVWSVGDHQLVAGVGSDSVWGVGDSPGYSYDVTGMSNPTTAVLSMAGIDGNDGGWPVLFGTDPVQSNQLFLAIDEDQFKDDERRHTSEQVAYVVLRLQTGVGVSSLNNSYGDKTDPINGPSDSTEEPSEKPPSFTTTNETIDTYIEVMNNARDSKDASARSVDSILGLSSQSVTTVLASIIGGSLYQTASDFTSEPISEVIAQPLAVQDDKSVLSDRPTRPDQILEEFSPTTTDDVAGVTLLTERKAAPESQPGNLRSWWRSNRSSPIQLVKQLQSLLRPFDSHSS